MGNDFEMVTDFLKRYVAKKKSEYDEAVQAYNAAFRLAEKRKRIKGIIDGTEPEEVDW